MVSCYSNSCKNMCARVVGVFSVILGLLGIGVAVVGAQASGLIPEDLKKAIEDMGVDLSFLEQIGTPIIALGVIIIVISVLGCATAKFKNPCFALPFGLINLILGIIFLVIGGLCLVGVASTK